VELKPEVGYKRGCEKSAASGTDVITVVEEDEEEEGHENTEGDSVRLGKGILKRRNGSSQI
jgi:hypothetical protein